MALLNPYKEPDTRIPHPTPLGAKVNPHCRPTSYAPG